MLTVPRSKKRECARKRPAVRTPSAKKKKSSLARVSASATNAGAEVAAVVATSTAGRAVTPDPRHHDVAVLMMTTTTADRLEGPTRGHLLAAMTGLRAVVLRLRMAVQDHRLAAVAEAPPRLRHALVRDPEDVATLAVSGRPLLTTAVVQVERVAHARLGHATRRHRSALGGTPHPARRLSKTERRTHARARAHQHLRQHQSRSRRADRWPKTCYRNPTPAKMAG